MPTPRLTIEQMQEAVDAVARNGGNQTRAAVDIKLGRSALQSRLRYAAEHGLVADGSGESSLPEPADLPPSDLPFEERLEIKKRRNALAIAHVRAQAWQPVTIPVSGAFGLCFFGDPHLDDPFCNLSLIEQHASICRDTPGLYGVNGGDSVNNWVGRLERLHGNQSTTTSEAWELVEWFMNGLGIRWALWLAGNHDCWNNGYQILERMNAQKIVMRDWDAKVRLVSPDGECKLWARHDFKGTSIYNELHGLKRAAMFSPIADILCAFHRHTWGTSSGEGEDGKRFSLVRAKGYKEEDDHALKNQFTQQLHGQSVVAVVRPRRGMDPLVSLFEDVETGADFLTYLRRKDAA